MRPQAESRAGGELAACLNYRLNLGWILDAPTSFGLMSAIDFMPSAMMVPHWCGWLHTFLES